jgi:hypothetical protein
VLPLGRFALPALLAALVAAPLAVAAPASAVPTGSTATDDVVLYPHCQQHPITYDLAVDPGTAFWHLEVLLLDPDGHTSEQRVATSATSPTHGTVTYQFCGSEKAGTWTVRATGFYETLPLLQLPLTLPDTTFTVRPTETRTTLARRPLGHGRYRLTALVHQEAEQGYARADGAPVRLERLVRGTWHQVRGLALTTVRGRAVARIAGHPGQRLRAVVPDRNSLGGSTSKVVIL